MSAWNKLIRIIFGGLATLTTYLFGEPDAWLKMLLLMVITDYLSGVVAAYINSTMSSKKGLIGIIKKVMFFFIVAVAHVIDVVTNAGGVLRNLTIGFLIANEGISILENCGRCGVPLPQKLIDVLEQLRDKPDDK